MEQFLPPQNGNKKLFSTATENSEQQGGFRSRRCSPKYERSSRNSQQREGIKVKKKESYKKHENKMMRSGSFENKGLFLNMVFPFSFKSKKKKGFASNNSGKVSPKPEILKGVAEKYWWKKRLTGSGDSNSSRTRNNSGSSGRRSKRETRTINGFLSGVDPVSSVPKEKRTCRLEE